MIYDQIKKELDMHFSIEGEYITNFLREIFIEEGFGEAYKIFKSTFDDLSIEFLVDILKGEKKFDGTNEFDFVDDEQSEEYLNNLNYTYECLLKDGKSYYRPCSIVSANIHPSFYRENLLMTSCINSDDKIYEINGSKYVFELVECSDYPFFIRPCKTPGESLKQYLKYSSLSNITNEMVYRQSEVSIDKLPETEQLKIYKTKILEQTNNFVEIKYPFNGQEKTLKIPEEPFHLWCLGHDNYKFYDIIKWAPVVPQGFKMTNDNQYHSDWILGADLDLENYYEKIQTDEEYKAIDEAVWSYAFDYSLQMKKKYNLI